MAAAVLVLTLLAGGCAKMIQKPSDIPASDPSAPEEPASPDLDGAPPAAQKAAMEKLESYRWPKEPVQKEILGREMEFILYHGNGWTIQVPASWEESNESSSWVSPSQCASFQVDQQFLGVNNPKWYRAQQGSWRHETDYDPPFDYCYDDDGGYTPPAGSADYLYFFAPDGEDRSFEFTLFSVVGETTEEERAIQEAMLLSFCLDRSSHVLHSEAYTPGLTEWEAALAGLLAQGEPIWFHMDNNSGVWEEIIYGKRNPDYLPCALALAEYHPSEFTQTFFGRQPEAAPEPGGEMITLCLPEMKIWLYFYAASPWVNISHAGEDYWAQFYNKDGSSKMIFDAVQSWLEAERRWADHSAGAGTESA